MPFLTSAEYVQVLAISARPSSTIPVRAPELVSTPRCALPSSIVQYSPTMYVLSVTVHCHRPAMSSQARPPRSYHRMPLGAPNFRSLPNGSAHPSFSFASCPLPPLYPFERRRSSTQPQLSPMCIPTTGAGADVECPSCYPCDDP